MTRFVAILFFVAVTVNGFAAHANSESKVMAPAQSCSSGLASAAMALLIPKAHAADSSCSCPANPQLPGDSGCFAWCPEPQTANCNCGSGDAASVCWCG